MDLSIYRRGISKETSVDAGVDASKQENCKERLKRRERREGKGREGGGGEVSVLTPDSQLPSEGVKIFCGDNESLLYCIMYTNNLRSIRAFSLG